MSKMIEVESKVKKWGNASLAFIIPKEVVKERKIKPNQIIRVIIEEDENVLRKTFGMLKGKLKQSTEEILEEVDRDLWGE